MRCFTVVVAISALTRREVTAEGAAPGPAKDELAAALFGTPHPSIPGVVVLRQGRQWTLPPHLLHTHEVRKASAYLHNMLSTLKERHTQVSRTEMKALLDFVSSKTPAPAWAAESTVSDAYVAPPCVGSSNATRLARRIPLVGGAFREPCAPLGDDEFPRECYDERGHKTDGDGHCYIHRHKPCGDENACRPGTKCMPLMSRHYSERFGRVLFGHGNWCVDIQTELSREEDIAAGDTDPQPIGTYRDLLNSRFVQELEAKSTLVETALA